jgi:hypothetical protein
MVAPSSTTPLEASEIVPGIICIPFNADGGNLGIVTTVDNPGVFQQPTFAKIADHSTKGAAQVQLAAILVEVAKHVKARLVVEIVQGSNSKDFGPFKPFMRDKISDVIRERTEELNLNPSFGAGVRARHRMKHKTGEAQSPQDMSSDTDSAKMQVEPVSFPGDGPSLYLNEDEVAVRDAKSDAVRKKRVQYFAHRSEKAGGKRRRRTGGGGSDDNDDARQPHKKKHKCGKAPKRDQMTEEEDEETLAELLREAEDGAGRSAQNTKPVTLLQLEDFYEFCDSVDPNNGSSQTIAAYRVCLYIPSNQLELDLPEVMQAFSHVLSQHRETHSANAKKASNRRKQPPLRAHETFKNILTPCGLMAAASRAHGEACSPEELAFVIRSDSFGADNSKGSPLMMYRPRADNPDGRYDKRQCDRLRQQTGNCFNMKHMFEISLPMYAHHGGVLRLLETPLPDIRYDNVLHPFIHRYVQSAMAKTTRRNKTCSAARMQRYEATYMASFGAPPCLGYSGMSFDAKVKNAPTLARIKAAKEAVMKKSEIPEEIRKAALSCMDLRHRLKVTEAHLAAINANVPDYASPTQQACHAFLMKHIADSPTGSLCHLRPKTFRGGASTAYYLQTGLLRRETCKLSTWHNNSVLLDLAAMTAFNHWVLGVSILQLGPPGLGKSKCQEVLKDGFPKGVHDNAGRRTRFLNSAPGNFDSDIYVIDEKPEDELGYMKGQYGGKETPAATMNKARLTNMTREDVTLSLKFDDDSNRLRDKLVQKNGHVEVASSNIPAEFALSSMLDRYHKLHFTKENAEIASDFIRIVASRISANMDTVSHNDFRQWLFAMVAHTFFLMTVNYGLPPVETPVCNKYLGDLLVECESRGLPDTTNARAIGRVISLTHVGVVVRQVLTHFNFASSDLVGEKYASWQWQRLATGMCDTLPDFCEAVGFLKPHWEKSQTCRVLRAWYELSFHKQAISAAEAAYTNNKGSSSSSSASGRPQAAPANFGTTFPSVHTSSSSQLSSSSTSPYAVVFENSATNDDEEMEMQMATANAAATEAGPTMGWGTNRDAMNNVRGPRPQSVLMQKSQSLHAPARGSAVKSSSSYGVGGGTALVPQVVGSLVLQLQDAVNIAHKRAEVKQYQDKFILVTDSGARTGLDLPRSGKSLGQNLVGLVETATSGLLLRRDTRSGAEDENDAENWGSEEVVAPSALGKRKRQSSSSSSVSQANRQNKTVHKTRAAWSGAQLLLGHDEVEWFKSPLRPNSNGLIPVSQAALNEVTRRCRRLNSDLDALDDLQKNMKPLQVNANGVAVFMETSKQSQIAGRISKKLNLPFNLIMDILRAQTGEHAVTLYRNGKPVTTWQQNISWASDLNGNTTSVHPNVFRHNTTNIMLSALQHVLEKDKRLRPSSFSFGTDTENANLRAYPCISPDLAMPNVTRSRHVCDIADRQRANTKFAKALSTLVLEGIRGEVVTSDEYWEKQVPNYNQLHPADALWHLHVAKQCIPNGMEEVFGALHPDVTSEREDAFLMQKREDWIQKELRDANAVEGGLDLTSALRTLKHDRLAGKRPMVATRLLSYEHLDKKDSFLYPRELIKCMSRRGML